MSLGSLDYYWRLAATGGCFAAFGIGGLLLSTLVFPTLQFLPAERRKSRARWLIHKSFGIFMRLMQAAGVMRFEVTGAERLRDCRHTLVLANHPTLIDVVALVSLMPDASCVVKRDLWKNPFLGGVVRAAGYISNAEPEQLIADCAEDVAAGNPLLVFPEGTRSQPGRPLHFLRGAAYMALASGMPILPVLIRCSPATLAKNDKWYRIPPCRFRLAIEVHEPVAASRWVAPGDRSPIAARRLSEAMERYFTKALEQHGHAGI